MTGCLKIKNGTFYAVLNLKEGGKYKQKWVSTKLKVKGNKYKATDFLNKLMAEHEEKEAVADSADILFSDYLMRWLEKKKNKVELTTWEGYRNITIKHLIPYFKNLGLTLNQLKPKHFVDYYDSKTSGGRLDGKNGGLSNKYIKEHGVVIKNALNKAVIEETICKNPALHVPLPKKKEEKNQVFLNANQANEVLSFFKGHRLQPE